MTDRDIRAAVEHAAADVLSPGSRVERWQAMVPKLVGRAGRAGQRHQPAWAPAVVRANNPLPAPRRRLAAIAVALVLITAGASTSATLSGRTSIARLSASRLPGRQPPLISLASLAPVCPFGESRYDNADAGYHFCLGTDWSAGDLTPSDRQIISVAGLRLGPGSSGGPRHDGGPAIEVSVEWQSHATNLSYPPADAAPILIGGEAAFLIGDGADDSRTAVVEHEGRVYRLQLHTSDVAAGVQFEEILRTFAFQRLPYVADPEFRLGKQTG